MFRLIMTALLALSLLASPVHADTDWVAVVAQARYSIARIHGIFHGKSSTFCTAISINDAKDYFLTAKHCDLRSYTDEDNKLDDGKIWVEGHEAFPIYEDQIADLEVLAVPDSGEVPALHLATTIAPGEEVAMYGWGFGLDFPVVRISHIAAPSLVFPMVFEHYSYGGLSEEYTLLDSGFIHGMSGGPVIDKDGHLVTIVQANVDDDVGVGRSAPELLTRIGKYLEK